MARDLGRHRQWPRDVVRLPRILAPRHEFDAVLLDKWPIRVRGRGRSPAFRNALRGVPTGGRVGPAGQAERMDRPKGPRTTAAARRRVQPFVLRKHMLGQGQVKAKAASATASHWPGATVTPLSPRVSPPLSPPPPPPTCAPVFDHHPPPCCSLTCDPPHLWLTQIQEMRRTTPCGTMILSCGRASALGRCTARAGQGGVNSRQGR